MGITWATRDRAARLARPQGVCPGPLGDFELAHSGGSENKAAGNLPTAELIQCLVRIGKGASCYLATHFAGGSHYQNLPQILSGSDGGSLDTDFSRGHQDRGKAYWISRQAHNQESTRGPQTIERRVVGCSRCRCHQRHVNSASIAQFPDHIGCSSIDCCRST